MPLALAWEDRDEDRVRNLRTSAVAKVRQQANVGVMGDAFADEVVLPRVWLRHVQAPARSRPRRASCSSGRTAAFAQLAGSDFASLPAARPQGSSSNTVVVMGERLMLKGYRRLRAGASPELEMGLYLTEVVHYRNCAPLAGVLEYTGNDGEPRLLALLQAYVANQGDGWTYSLEYLRRHLEEHRTAPATDALPTNAHEAYLNLIRVLAVRTAELHTALATTTRRCRFDPQPLTPADFDGYRQRASDEVRGTLALLQVHTSSDLAAADREQGGRGSIASGRPAGADRAVRDGGLARAEDTDSR